MIAWIGSLGQKGQEKHLTRLHVFIRFHYMKSNTTSTSEAAMNVRRFRERLRERGLVKKDVWILPEYADDLSALEKSMREPGWVPSSRSAAAPSQAWTLGSIEEALRAHPLASSGLLAVEHIEGAEPSLRLTVKCHREESVDVLLAVSGEQILVESYLWANTEITDPVAFNDYVLHTHKYLPLSTFSLTDVGGVPSYTLFGSLDSRSTLQCLMFEIQSLAENARASRTLYAEFLRPGGAL